MIQKKRFFLPIFFGLGVLVFEETRDFIYMPFIVTPCFFVLFWNFPKISNILEKASLLDVLPRLLI